MKANVKVQRKPQAYTTARHGLASAACRPAAMRPVCGRRAKRRRALGNVLYYI